MTQDDITISMFINRESNADTFAMILHGTQVGKASPQGHLGLINKDKLLDMEYRIGGATVAHLTAKDEKDNNIITPTNQWTHIAIVTNGAENMAKLYLDGVLAGTVEGICKPSQLVAQNNYLGRFSWADDDYKATFDEFEVYNGLLTEQEIQEIANEKLCKTPVTDIHERLALTLQSGAAFDKSAVTENLNLPTTMETSDGKTIQGLKITWQSDNPAIRTDGTVIRPSKGRNDAIVNLTAKIQYGSYMLTKVFSDITVKESDTVSFVVFDEVFEQAKAKYESGAAENIYTQASLEALGAKITAAEAVKATEGTDAADADQVDEMVAQLEAAMNGLELKSFAELNKTLAAWYPLDDNKAKDASGHGVDGAPADSIVFNRENGAAFNGGTARKNIIQLPKESLDKLNLTDQMTFSFWTNIAEDRNLFGMGSLIGENDSDKKDNGGRSKHFYVKSTLNAFMTANGWAQDAHKGFGNIKVSRNEWHHIAVVINGQKMTLYIDKQKVNDTVDTDITMTAAWNHNEGANRYFYIGNCAYGHNGDADFKGSIRDFHIYNAALAQKQIEDAYGYLGNIDMEYAKADLIKEIGARAEDNGQFTLNVTNENTTNKVFNLPKTSYGEAKVAWKSTDNAILNADTGLAAIPDQKEAEKKVDLTATITIGDGEQQRTEEIVFKCKVYYRNNIPTTDLENALNALKGKNLNESDYTAASWAALQAAIAEAQAQIDNPDSEQAVADAKNKLAAEEGNLVNIAGLREKVKTLEEELKGLKDKENDYSQASWDGLQEKLAAAKKVLGTSDATAAAVSEVTNALPQTAASALKACGNKKPLENAIADAETLGTYKDAYTEASWAALEKALQTAKEELAKRLEDYASAAAALTKAAEALEIKADHKLEGAVKEGLEEKLAEAKAEKLSSGNYTQRTWSVYQEALEVFEAVLGRANATKDEAEAAAKALEDARAALEPIASQKPDEEKKQEFTTAYEEAVQASADLKPEAYTQESWNRYQNALAAMEKLSKRLAEANNNVTKDEIDATITELNEAVAALVKNVDKDALDKAIAEFGKLKASAYTTKTWKPFKDALDAAKKVSVNADATQEEVDNALKTLNAKKKALKKIVKVTGLTLSAASKSIAIGKKVTVKPTVKPSNATDKTVSWKSSNTKWATVKNGVVSMKKAGAGKTVTITAIAKDGSKKKAAIKIKIMKNAVTKVSFKIKSKAVKNGKKITLKPDIKTNGKKANKKLSWKSSNTKWATVNAKGVVATKKAGKGKTVTITATSTDGTNKKASVKVKITK